MEKSKKRPGYAQTIPGVSLKEEKEGYDHTMGRISRKEGFKPGMSEIPSTSMLLTLLI